MLHDIAHLDHLLCRTIGARNHTIRGKVKLGRLLLQAKDSLSTSSYGEDVLNHLMKVSSLTKDCHAFGKMSPGGKNKRRIGTKKVCQKTIRRI